MDAHEPRRLPPDWLELRDLRYFLAVAEELNFTRAAERLHLAQQALSAAIRNLEADLGVQLFSRSTRHVALTPAGEALVDGARHVLASAAEAVDDVMRVGSGRAGRLIIGFSTAAGSVPKVRDIIRRFSRAAPDVDVRLVEYDFSDPTAGLGSGGSQVAFVFNPLADASLEAVTVFEELRHVALPMGHPLAAADRLQVTDLSGLPWLSVPAPDSPWTRFWFRHPLGEAQAGVQIRTADEWVAAIESGRGVAYTLPAVMANFPNTEITTRAITDLEPGAVLLAWRGDDRDPAVAAFVRAAHESLAAD
ncbi:MAG TPA: LysR substrate-binding domain-containing protein [Candidatus Limnocylindria bacterium]|nr:LysR substrate-binding domain-containing protein [Candidatus Limnocylindria bacterium]